MQNPLDVVVLGPLNIDLIVVGNAPREVEALVNWMALSDVTLNVAGSGGYPALVLQKLGLQVGMLSIVASDSLGEVIRRELSGAGVNLARVRSAPNEKSSIAIYMLLFGSKKRPLTGRPVLHQPWPDPLDEADQRYVESTRLIHIAGYLHYPQMWTDSVPTLLKAAKARGQKVSLDPQFPLYPIEGRWMRGIEKLLPHVDVLLVDEDEARGITGAESVGEAGQILCSTGPQIVAIKRGAQGSVLFPAQGDPLEVPALAVPESEIVDTIGAGDAFDGGFLAAWLAGHSIQECAHVGSYVAARSLHGHGAANALPSEDTLPIVIERALLAR